jgi:hypothetical protein
MSLKAELSIWASALKAYDAQDVPTSLAEFGRIADTSKINWNIGVIHATLGEHQSAVEWFARAVGMDGFLTVGYMQMGVSNFVSVPGRVPGREGGGGVEVRGRQREGREGGTGEE